jgi:hypothetical protein
VLTRLLSHGWLEENTMGVLRSKLIERLRKADHEGRFHVYYPHMPGLADGTCIDLHSKMMAVDDEWLRIGSANLNNRSMGVDTECDVALEAAGRADVSRAIRGLRDKLLAEHLGASVDEVVRQLDAQGTIAGAIEALHSDQRTLSPLEVEPYSDVVLSLAELADPEEAIGLEELTALFTVGVERHRLSGPARIGLAIVAIAGVTYLVWRFAPQRRRLARLDRLLGR